MQDFLAWYVILIQLNNRSHDSNKEEHDAKSIVKQLSGSKLERSSEGQVECEYMMRLERDITLELYRMLWPHIILLMSKFSTHVAFLIACAFLVLIQVLHACMCRLNKCFEVTTLIRTYFQVLDIFKFAQSFASFVCVSDK